MLPRSIASMRLTGWPQLLPDPLLAGEIKGEIPDGFEMNNSPAALVKRNRFTAR